MRSSRLAPPLRGVRARGVERAFFGFMCVSQLMAAVACSTEPGSEPSGPRVIPTVGGQSGQEGSCLFGKVDELLFDPDATLGAVIGSHETTLRWNDNGDSVAAADTRLEREPASIEISARGEPEVKLECGGWAGLDVDVRLQAPESEVDVTFEAMAQTFGAGNVVVLAAELDPAFRSEMTGPARKFMDDLLRVPTDATKEVYYFDMWQFRERISGHLIGRHDRGGCGLAVWPEVYCDDWAVAMPVAEALGDLDVTRVLDAVAELGERALEWSDGRSARVHFEVEIGPGLACTGPYLHRYGDAPTGGTDIQLAAQVRLTSDDATLDVTLPGKVVATVLDGQDFTGRVRVEAATVVSDDAAEAGRVSVAAPAEDRALRVLLNVERGANADEISVSVSSVPATAGRTDREGSDRDDAMREFECSGAAAEAGTIDTLLEGSFRQER